MFIHSIFGEGYSCNSFLLVDEVSLKAIIIDPGLNGQKILSFVDKNNLEAESIFLTHGHFDHIEDITLIQNKFPHIKVYLHELEEDFLKDKKLNCAFFVCFNYELNINIKPHLLKSDEEIIFANNKIKVLHTPFHTRGSVCFYLEKQKALFSGDCLFKDSIGRSDLPTSDPRLVDKSLNKIKSLDLETIVYPGHGPLTTILEENHNNIFLQRKDGI